MPPDHKHMVKRQESVMGDDRQAEAVPHQDRITWEVLADIDHAVAAERPEVKRRKAGRSRMFTGRVSVH